MGWHSTDILGYAWGGTVYCVRCAHRDFAERILGDGSTRVGPSPIFCGESSGAVCELCGESLEDMGPWRIVKRQTKTVYVVTSGLRGYLPANTSYYDTLGQARDCAKSDKSDWLDYGAQSAEYCSRPTGDIRVTGNIRRDWEYSIERFDGDTWAEWQYIAISREVVTLEDLYSGVA